LLSQHLQGYSYVKYTVNDGLAANHVLSVAEDANGFMWFATLNAVQWFDGLKFHTVQKGDGIHELPSLNRVNIYKLPDAGLLFVYLSGFSVYNTQLHVFTHYSIKGSPKLNFLQSDGSTVSFLTANTIVQFNLKAHKVEKTILLNAGDLDDNFAGIEVNNDLILLNSEAGRNLLINSKTGNVKYFQSLQQKVSAFTGNFYKNDKFLIFAEEGVIQKSLESGAVLGIAHYPANTRSEIRSVIKNFRLSDNLFAVSIGQHLFVYNAAANSISSEIVSLQKDLLLQNGYAETIYVDSHQNIWLCSNTQGVYKINYLPNNFKLFTPKETTDFSIAVEVCKEDNVVISGSYGNGIFIYDTSGILKNIFP